MKVAAAIAAFIGGIIVCYFLMSMGFVNKTPTMTTLPQDPNQSISIYLSFLGVMLTALTAVLTALAIGIGIVAAFTFSGIKTEALTLAKSTSEATATATAKSTAETTARTVASDELSDVRLMPLIEKAFAIYVRGRDQNAEWGPDNTDAE